MNIFMLPIPFLSALFFRLGGVGETGRFLPFMKPGCKMAGWLPWRGIGIPLMIGLLTWNWVYIVTYFLALNLFSYGENYWIRKIFGKYPCWIIYGFMFGIASLNWVNGIASAAIFTILMHLSNAGIPIGNDKHWYLDHSFCELGIGFLGTLIYLFR